MVQYKYGESGQVQTWFSESVPHEPYHCFLPASPPPLAVRIVLPVGTDDATRDKVLGAVVKVLATKGFSVEVSSWARDVFVLCAESAPRIEELLHPALPHRIEGVDVIFHARCAFPRRDALAFEEQKQRSTSFPKEAHMQGALAARLASPASDAHTDLDRLKGGSAKPKYVPPALRARAQRSRSPALRRERIDRCDAILRS